MIVNVKEEWIKPIVNISFFLFLSALTIYGLVHITSNPIIQIIIGIIAFILDTYMLFILSKAKFLLKTGVIKDKWIAGGYLFVYTVYTILYVFLFAVGFYLAELNTNEAIAKTNEEIKILQLNQIKLNQVQANALAEGLSKEVQTTYGKRSAILDSKISQLAERSNELLQKLEQASIKNEQVTNNFLQSLSQTFSWDINQLKAILFGVLVLLMQFSLISSAFNIKIDNNGKVQTLDNFKKELLIFLDALFEGRTGNALNGVHTISEKTGIPLDRCFQLRKYLSELKVNGGMAISVSQGSSTANYSKDFIRTFIINH